MPDYPGPSITFYKDKFSGGSHLLMEADQVYAVESDVMGHAMP